MMGKNDRQKSADDILFSIRFTTTNRQKPLVGIIQLCSDAGKQRQS